MALWLLDSASVDRFLARAELGMGYQFGLWLGEPVIVLGASIALDREALFDNTTRDRLSRWDATDDDGSTVKDVDIPLIEGVEVNDDVDAFERFASVNASPSLRRRVTPLHSSPPFASVARQAERFVRTSAFRNDRRFDASTSSYLAGTFATTARDFMNFAPSWTALACVGRYALPSPLPPVHMREFVVPAGTPLLQGTVAPAFAQAGGGVEVEFSSKVTLLTSATMILDER